ncbi:TonB-dependent receptor [Filimonas effusa]|uniref:TonB-dependent siderophore receptor n=1 Tax=Filimonas effusa TaxID=2508721 RepID=A0A4Q1CZ12_9BACT|nr:TonB-dependent receptor [Filimonas effusa]RXK80595.1 TonB-dependent siderophore receptor [Filimonas effusa]
MKQLQLLALCIFSFFRMAVAQNTAPAIRGNVVTSDNQPVPGISIRIEGSSFGTISDDKGEFLFKKLKPGTYQLLLSAVGIGNQQQSVQVTAGGTATAKFIIQETATELENVLVNAGRRNKYAIKSSDYVARMPLKNLENPQVYTTISAELIKDQVIVDYRDAFRNVAGVNSLEQVSNGRTSAFIRGFRTGNYMRNGLVASQLTATEVANLEKIEIIKGPSGTLFGSSSISYGGVVNRVTKKPFETASTEIAFTGGSFGLNRITVDMNTPLNKQKTTLFRLNAARHSAGSFQENGFQTNYFIAPSFQYKVNDKLTLSADMELYNNYGTNTGIGFTPSAAAYPGMKSYEGLNNIYKRTFSSDDLTSTLKGYTFFAKADYKISSQWSASLVYTYAGVNAKDQLQFTPTLLRGDSVSRTVQRYAHSYYNNNAQLNFNGDLNIAHMRHRILIGGDMVQSVTNPTYIKRFVYDTVAINGVAPYITRDKIDQRLAQLSPTSAFKSNTYNFGIYASDLVNLTENLMVMLAVRYDKVDAKGTTSFITNATTGAYTKSTFSPKAGLIYQVVKDKVSVFGNYLNGFNYSTSTDKNGKLFNPERANQWEGGVKTELLDGKLAATISYYNIKVSDKLRTNPDDVNFQIQDGTQLSKGLEVEVNSSPIPGLNIIAGYAYNKSEYTKSNANIQGKTPARAPGSIANGWISYQLQQGVLKGLRLGAGVNYQSNSWYDDVNTFTIPEFLVFNSVVSYDFPQWRLYFRLDNISNEKYWGPWGNAQAPRNFAAGVAFKF